MGKSLVEKEVGKSQFVRALVSRMAVEEEVVRGNSEFVNETKFRSKFSGMASQSKRKRSKESHCLFWCESYGWRIGSSQRDVSVQSFGPSCRCRPSFGHSCKCRRGRGKTE